MSKFKVGDRVVFRVAADVDAKGFPHNGHEATVIDLGGSMDYRIKFDDEAELPVFESELSPVPQDESPREIAFEDIKKGDDIEARWERDGVVTTRRGIAYSPSLLPRPAYWYAEAGGLVANNRDGWKHFLHSRPAPAEPKGLGALIRTGGVELISINRTPGTARWLTVTERVSGGGRYPGYWSDFDPDSIEELSKGIEVES